MDDDSQRTAQEMSEAADRSNELADVAELMGDDNGAARFRSRAERLRMEAMAILDE